MNALFDSAGLAIVAYAEVVGANGTSTGTNSGVVTTRTATGSYTVSLPANNAQQGARNLIFVQPTTTTNFLNVGPSATVNQANSLMTSPPTGDATKLICISNGTTLIDSDFNILILRTICPNAAGTP